MTGATDKDWNSATTLYISRRLHEIAGGRALAVLDLGCGAGKTLGYLLDSGLDLYGYDLVAGEDEYAEARRLRLLPHFGDRYEGHIKVTSSERDIPFGDESFDVLYANQVFEHVRFLDRMLAECARVLRPGGVLLANFPLATYPIEGHLRVPFAHWLPPGRLRVRYLQLWRILGVMPGQAGRSSFDNAVDQDLYLREHTFYRFMNEVLTLSDRYFEYTEVETTALVQAKIDLLNSAGSGTSAMVAGLMESLERGGRLSSCVTHLLNAAFCMRAPRKMSA
jgi:SAM-dependent methyltransferase